MHLPETSKAPKTKPPVSVEEYKSTVGGFNMDRKITAMFFSATGTTQNILGRKVEAIFGNMG